MMKQNIQSKFKELFKSEPKLFRAPARINVIGEHTDYNKGFVLPTAINKELYFAVAPNRSYVYRFYAYDLEEYVEIPTSQIAIQTKNTWANYLLGVIAQIIKNGKAVSGVDVVVGGNIPLGAGLSSSAAMECGFVFALNSIFNFRFSKLEMVQMAQLAEHEYAGVNCGIMDQFAVMFSEQNSVLKLDCRSLEYELMPLKLDGYTIVLCNSGVTHSLASSEYNLRRQECERGVEIVSKKYQNVESLRDVTIEMLNNCKNEMESITYNRCSFVIEENMRLESACEALQNSDLEVLGKLIYGSHYGLKDKYEVSCAELDELVTIAEQSAGVLGARMVGGGFGGCTLNIVHNDYVPEFAEKVNELYYKKYNKQKNIILAELAQGVSQVI